MGWKKFEDKDKLYEQVSYRLYNTYTKDTIKLLEELKNKMLMTLQTSIPEEMKSCFSDDSFHYLSTHIIGLGKDKFYEVIDCPHLMIIMGESHNYNEGFDYCFIEPKVKKDGVQILI